MIGTLTEKWTQVLFTPAPAREPSPVRSALFQPTHTCVNCERHVELDRHGRCAHCASDALYPA